MRYEFNTKAKASKFAKALRKSFILTERTSDHTVELWGFDSIRDDKKQWVLSVAEKVYNEIMS